jgi:hypothetical protein
VNEVKVFYGLGISSELAPVECGRILSAGSIPLIKTRERK